MRNIPARFAIRTVALHKTAMRGQWAPLHQRLEWLKRLPELIADCERRWSLTILPSFAILLATTSHSVFARTVRASSRFSEKGISLGCWRHPSQ